MLDRVTLKESSEVASLSNGILVLFPKVVESERSRLDGIFRRLVQPTSFFATSPPLVKSDKDSLSILPNCKVHKKEMNDTSDSDFELLDERSEHLEESSENLEITE